MRGWMTAGLALCLVACSRDAEVPSAFNLAHGAGPVERTECRQGECTWTQHQSVTVLGKASDGIKLKVVSRSGNSVHGIDAEPPETWNPGIEVEWRTEASYFFCSLIHPAMLWRSDDGFLLDKLDLYTLPGAQVASANEYMAACHSIAPEKWDENTLKQLGYAKSGSGQTRYPTLDAGLAAMEQGKPTPSS